MTTTTKFITRWQSTLLGRLLASVEGSTSAQRSFCLQHIQTKGETNIPRDTAGRWIELAKSRKSDPEAEQEAAHAFRAKLASRVECHIANGVGQTEHDAWAGTPAKQEAPAPTPRPEAKAVAAPAAAKARRWRNVKANAEGQFVVAGIRVQVSKSGMNVQTFA